MNYDAGLGATPPTFEYREGDAWRERPVRTALTVNAADAFQAACLAGLGIAQAPRAGMQVYLAAGRLVEVLPGHTAAPMPVSVLHAQGRSPPARVRVFTAWLERVLAPHLDGLG